MRSRIADAARIALVGLVLAAAPAMAQKVIDLGTDTVRVSHRGGSHDVEVSVTTKGDTAIIIRRAPGSDTLVTTHDSDLVRTGESITIDADQVIGGDVVSIGGMVTVNGRVHGDVVALGGDVVVKDGGQVDGDAVSVGGRVIREPGARINGQNVGMSFIPAGIFSQHGPGRGPLGILKGISFLVLAAFFLKLLFVLGVGWAARALAGHNVDQFSRTVIEGPWRSLFVGLVAHFAFVILIVLFSISVIGLVVSIPAGIALIPLNAIALSLVAALVGQRIGGGRPDAPGSPGSWLVSALIGLAILAGPVILGLVLLGIGGAATVLALVLLFFGGTIMTLAGATGFGAMVLTLFEGRRRSHPVPPGGFVPPPAPVAPPPMA